MNLFGIQNSDTTFTQLASRYRLNFFLMSYSYLKNFTLFNVNMILHTLFYMNRILYKSIFKFLSQYWTEIIIVTRIWRIIATNVANLIVLVSFATLTQQLHLSIHSPIISFDAVYTNLQRDAKDISIVLLLLQVVWVISSIIIANIRTIQYIDKFFSMSQFFCGNNIAVYCWQGYL